MQGVTSNIALKQSQPQQNPPVRYGTQYYKLQKNSAQADHSQYQLHYQVPNYSQNVGLGLQSHYLNQSQQQQNSTTPDYQINNMFAKLSVNDIQLSQSQQMNQVTGLPLAKSQGVNRKLFTKQNTQMSSSGAGGLNMMSQANDILANSNTLSGPSQNLNQNMLNADHYAQLSQMNNHSSGPMYSQNMQQPQAQDSLFTRPLESFEISSRTNSNVGECSTSTSNTTPQPHLFTSHLTQLTSNQMTPSQSYRFQSPASQYLQTQQQTFSTSGGVFANNQGNGGIINSMVVPNSQSPLIGQQNFQSRLDSQSPFSTIAQTELNRSMMQNSSTPISVNSQLSSNSNSGAQTNRPNSTVSFTHQNTFPSEGAATTRRLASSEQVQAEANYEVIISNIDRDTVGHIIHGLHSHGVQDLNYKLIEQQIFIVKFKNKDSATWAIDKYDQQEINGKKLSVKFVVEKQPWIKRRTQFAPLARINETNADGDEDQVSDNSNNSNKGDNKCSQNQAPPSLNQLTPDLSQIKKNMLAQQRANTPKLSSEFGSVAANQGAVAREGTASKYIGGVGGSANNYSATIMNLSNSPNSNFAHAINQNPLHMQSMNAMQAYQTKGVMNPSLHSDSQAKQLGKLDSNLQSQQQQLLYNGGVPLVTQSQAHFQDQYQSTYAAGLHQSFYQPSTNPILQKQISSPNMSFQQIPQQNATMTTKFVQYQQNMQIQPEMKRSNSGILKIQNKLAHTLQNSKIPDSITQIQGVSGQGLSSEQLQGLPGRGQELGLLKNLSFQMNTQKLQSDDFDEENLEDIDDKWSQAFGYNSSGSGLLIQQQPQQNNQLSFADNQASFGKISESIDDSQNEDINFCHLNYDVSNCSEKESFQNQTMRNAQNTQTVKNISTRSDSDHSHQLTHQIMVQQYQSPESGQKLAMTQRTQNLNHSLDYMIRSNSGRDTPPKFSTPGSKLNNSFHHFGSSQNLSNYIRINNEIPSAATTQQIQGPFHSRNFSAEQQFYQSEIMQQQLYLPQNLNSSNLNHSMSMQSMQQFPTQYYNYLSTSQDLNNISLYGQPISLNYQLTLSASNSSVDLNNQRIALQNRAKGKGASKQQCGGVNDQKNHQQLKSAYKESSEIMAEEYYNIDDYRIKSGEDMRTTVMIRNIPNKYKQKNLLDEINQNNKGKYDFVYLPIDFQNNANIGYGFVNFLNPLFILEFKDEFENRKWRRFQSQKKCELKYGRLQGIAQLNQHFQNSTVSNQVDVQVRPRVFDDNARKDWTKEIHRICNKYNLNPQTFMNFKSQNNQSFSTKPDAGSNFSGNSQQNINSYPQYPYNPYNSQNAYLPEMQGAGGNQNLNTQQTTMQNIAMGIQNNNLPPNTFKSNSAEYSSNNMSYMPCQNNGGMSNFSQLVPPPMIARGNSAFGSKEDEDLSCSNRANASQASSSFLNALNCAEVNDSASQTLIKTDSLEEKQ